MSQKTSGVKGENGGLIMLTDEEIIKEAKGVTANLPFSYSIGYIRVDELTTIAKHFYQKGQSDYQQYIASKRDEIAEWFYLAKGAGTKMWWELTEKEKAIHYYKADQILSLLGVEGNQ